MSGSFLKDSAVVCCWLVFPSLVCPWDETLSLQQTLAWLPFEISQCGYTLVLFLDLAHVFPLRIF